MPADDSVAAPAARGRLPKESLPRAPTAKRLLELHTISAPRRPSALEYPLHTERLTLRPANAEDAEVTWKYRRLATVNEWFTGCPPDLDSYRRLFLEPDRLASTVIVTLGPDAAAPIIGDFMLRLEDAWAQLDVVDQARNTQAELGWVLDPDHTDRGYATEAVRELLRCCFEDLGVRRVPANCLLDNHASLRRMERVGMRRELHAICDSLHRSGRWMDRSATPSSKTSGRRPNRPPGASTA